METDALILTVEGENSNSGEGVERKLKCMPGSDDSKQKYIKGVRQGGPLRRG